MLKQLRENVSLAELTTFKLGGKARYFARAETESDIINAVEFAAGKQLEIFILGGGSNILIADEGYDGLVLQIALKGVSISAGENDIVYVTARAGEDWDDFVAFCVERDWQGIECLSGIPGFVGGTPVQNVGAYGQEVSETIVSVRVFDRKTRVIRDLSNSECGFAYRASVFNTTEKNRYIVTAVTFALKKGGAPLVHYADLKKIYESRQMNLKDLRKTVCEIRERKGMLVRQTGADGRSAGSFFKNPIVSKSKLAELEKNLKFGDNERVPHYAIDEENVKIPAAWLIENSGFAKGHVKGKAGLSTRHTLALINRNGATARDILELMNEIQTAVRRKFGIGLKPEPIFVGFSESSKRLN